MKTILVDDERYGLERFEIECGKMDGIELVGKFRSSLDALAFAKVNQIDLAFLDIEMPEMSGLDLSDQLRALYPDIIVIFVSAYDQYMSDAFRQRGADYYVVKPYTKEEVEAVIARAKLLSRRFAKRIYIETFGRFCVSVDGKPVRFTSTDAKQLLALMVHKCGTPLGNQEAFNLMWEERNYDHSSAVSLHKALRKLKDTLSDAGIGDLVIDVPPSEHKVNTELFDCDYYQYLAGDAEAVRKFSGEYMSEWTWGEEVVGDLLFNKAP